jgi:hypothetical protein
MKKLLLLVVSLFVLFSCSKNIEQITVVKNEVEKRLSEIEKKGIDYNCTELSDREAYNEIQKYNTKRYEKAEKKYNEFMLENKLGKYRITPLEEMEISKINYYLKMMQLGGSLLNEVTRHQKTLSDDLKKLSVLKGENTYYKILVVKATPDTLLFNKVYLDNNNKIINTQYLK